MTTLNLFVQNDDQLEILFNVLFQAACAGATATSMVRKERDDLKTKIDDLNTRINDLNKLLDKTKEEEEKQ